MHKQKSRRRLAVLGIGIGLAAATLISSSVVAANPQPAFIPPTASWLTTVNYFRAMAGVGPVVEDASMSAGAVNHSCYMLYNGISHDETPGKTGYTPEGDIAGNSGDVAVSSQINTSARSHIELWMSGPFHAIGVLRPNLQSTGFGKCDLSTTPVWHSGATLDVIRGLGNAPRPASPIVFPGNGTTTEPRPLRHRITEPADLLRLDRRCRAAADRDDARSRYQRCRRPHRSRWAAARSLRVVGRQHHRCCPADPQRRQRRDHRAPLAAGAGHLQRGCQHPMARMSAGASRSTRPPPPGSPPRFRFRSPCPPRRPPAMRRWRPLESSTPVSDRAPLGSRPAA